MQVLRLNLVFYSDSLLYYYIYGVEQSLAVVFVSKLYHIFIQTRLLEALFVSKSVNTQNHTYSNFSSPTLTPRLSIAILSRGESKSKSSLSSIFVVLRWLMSFFIAG